MNKVAMVTGAGNGIGASTAQGFAKAGAKVAVVDTDEAAGMGTAEAIKSAGGEAIFIQCDVSNEDDVIRTIDTVISTFGRLDMAHNNVGITPDTGTTADCSKELWDKIMAVNVTGNWLCMKYEIQAMLKQGSGGAIVNTGSVSSLLGYREIPAYTASKHALVGLTKVAALENAADNIRINMVCPGVTKTPMLEKKMTDGYYADFDAIAQAVPMKRLSTPEEIADAVVWLCSDQASYVTGAVLSVDGGLVMGS